MALNTPPATGSPIPVLERPLKTATILASFKVNRALKQFFSDRVAGSLVFGSVSKEDEVQWFLSKRAHEIINRWLMNNRLSVLVEVSPQKTGYVSVTRERIEHILAHRLNQKVGSPAVEELLHQLFVEGGASYAQNQSMGSREGGYDHQLVMFRASYKSKNPAVSGESPSVILSYRTVPRPHLAIETGYWIRGSKATALQKAPLG